MSILLQVLILEDRAEDAELMLHELRRAEFEPHACIVATEADYLAALDPAPELILADYHLPQFDGVRALQALKLRDLDIPFIIVSGTIDEEIAVEAMRNGATDYLIKDRIARLGPAATHALEQKRLRDKERQMTTVLRESEKRYRQLVELAPYAIVVHSEGKIVFVNPASVKMMRAHDATELLGKAALDFVHTDSRQIAAGRIEQAMSLGTLAPAFEEKFITLDGTIIDTEVMAIPFRQNGESAMLVIIHDITERKQTADKIHQQLEELRMWHTVTLDREKRVLELKHEVNELLHQMNEPPRYPSAE